MSEPDMVVVNDEALTRVDSEIETEERVLGAMGNDDPSDPHDEQIPYRLEVAKPRAIDLLDFSRRARRRVTPEIAATLGAQVPILLWHGITAFGLPGKRPPRVWGMG